MKRIYFDYNATSPLRPEVLEAMLPHLREDFGNPSSLHLPGQKARKAVEAAREKVAALLGARDPSEIIFTAGGTESDNFAIKGMAFAHASKGRHIVASAIEHHAVLETCRYLEAHHGFRVTRVAPDALGIVLPEGVNEAIQPDTILVTIMTANNEIGTVQPVREIGAIAHGRGVAFHTDAVQAAGKMPLSTGDAPVEMLSLSAHKFGGPKGVGALYVRKATRLHAFIHGGRHEKNRRAGTENVAGIVGMGKAAELALSELPRESARLRALRDRFESGLKKLIPFIRLNGHPVERLPNTSNICFEFVEGESLAVALDQEGISASIGSACTTGSTEPSHVLTAIGLPKELAHAGLRFSSGHRTTKEDIEDALKIIPGVVERLRQLHPLWQEKATANVRKA